MDADRRAKAANTGSSAIGQVLIAAVWGLCSVFALAVAAEFAIRLIPAPEVEKPVFDTGREGPRGFATQYIHPHYLFFFPFDDEERAALNTPACKVDADGFRGEGPAFAGDRKLAFIVGGSSVFGQGSSDATTIVGALNELQSEYHFVNAGVQSWNSTQELFRVAYQILEFEPDLVIALDGANDIQIPIKYGEKGIGYPPGTPESFDELSRLVGDIEARQPQVPTRTWEERFFPRVSKAIRRLVSRGEEPERRALPDEVIAAAVDRYVTNHELMDVLVRARGGRFLSVFQPVTCLHEKVDTTLVPCRDPIAYRKFHRQVFEREAPFERLDFSKLFDAHFEVVPVFDPKGEVDISEQDIFFDAVHVWDAGDWLIAEALRDHLVEIEKPSKINNISPELHIPEGPPVSLAAPSAGW